jgi:hypothetical protein
MGLHRAFVQQELQQSTGSTVHWPNSGFIAEGTILGTAPVLIAVDRPGLNRRKLIIENDGSSPVLFALGGTTTLLAPTKRTGILYSGDTYIDDFPIWQGQVSAALPSGGLPPGSVNVTEGVVLL